MTAMGPVLERGGLRRGRGALRKKPRGAGRAPLPPGATDSDGLVLCWGQGAWVHPSPGASGGSLVLPLAGLLVERVALGASQPWLSPRSKEDRTLCCPGTGALPFLPSCLSLYHWSHSPMESSRKGLPFQMDTRVRSPLLWKPRWPWLVESG